MWSYLIPSVLLLVLRSDEIKISLFSFIGLVFIQGYVTKIQNKISAIDADENRNHRQQAENQEEKNRETPNDIDINIPFSTDEQYLRSILAFEQQQLRDLESKTKLHKAFKFAESLSKVCH
jgi:hypothetical protein